MKALADYDEFISDNIWKFHNLINDPENNRDRLAREIERFISELYNRAGECLDISIDTLNDPNVKLETVVALFMRASDLWHMFCSKYKEAYPDDPPYFDKTTVLEAFEYVYKKGFANNEDN